MEIHPTKDEMEAQIRANAIRPVLLNLYDIEEGFSLTIPGKNCKDSTTETFSYEERELLDCLENGELPWFLADILEHCPAAVYHEVLVFEVSSESSFINLGLRRRSNMRPSQLVGHFI